MKQALDKSSEPALIDAHAHLHDCFSPEESMLSALRNLRRYSARPQGTLRGFLLISALDATRPEASRRKLSELGPSFKQLPCDEPGSVSLQHVESGDRLDLVFGNQIVTAEGLEMLVYGHADPIPAGESLTSSIEAASCQQALVIIPWGFGKWMGKRGYCLSEHLEILHKCNAEEERFFLADSAARLRWTRPSRLLDRAAIQGLRNLPGSDPLPIASHHGKLGSFGFELDVHPDSAHPLASIRAALQDTRSQPRLFGQGESLPGFIYNQAIMQLRKRTPFFR